MAFDFFRRRAESSTSPVPRPKPRIGLALGSGAARGIAHIGVLRALTEIGIRPDVIAGTSMGALAGAAYACGLLDKLEEYARGVDARLVFRLLDIGFAGSGLLGGNRVVEFLEREFNDRRIELLSPTFVCVATELATGREIWLERGPLAPAIRASFSIPGVFQPMEVEGRLLVDGALVNPVPVSVCRALGADVIIAVSLSTDFMGRGVPAADQANVAPSLANVLIQSFNIAEDRVTRSRLAGDPPDILIGPRTAGIQAFEFQRAAEAIDLGREATLRVGDELKAFASLA